MMRRGGGEGEDLTFEPAGGMLNKRKEASA